MFETAELPVKAERFGAGAFGKETHYMKKLIAALILMLTVAATAYAEVQPADLTFTPEGGGKFIYCNNHESIYRSHLSDASNPNPTYIMNNNNQTAGKYDLQLSHLNRTDVTDEDGNITEQGFDIEIDVQFVARTDTVITFNTVGFSTADTVGFYEDGILKHTEANWGCIEAIADYMGRTIRQQGTNYEYTPTGFEPVTVTIEKGQIFWISSIIDNYTAVPWMKPVQLMSSFEIESGKIDINIAAMKASGTLKDRSQHLNGASFGSYDYDRCQIGIADTLPRTYSSVLAYNIDDSVFSGTALPVTIHNMFSPETGRRMEEWYTHVNPQTDIWSYALCTESDLLSFEYYDPEKKNYYGSKISSDDRDSIWHFDIYHSDTSYYTELSGVDEEHYIPNYELDLTQVNSDTGCVVGNYGVGVNYRVTISNDGANTRYFNFYMNNSANNIVSVKDSSGNYVGETLCKGQTETRRKDCMACIELPPGEKTSFMIEVILPMNSSGGMLNSFVITDEPFAEEVVNTSWQLSTPNFTGKEYYRWENGDIYTSEDLVNWTKHTLNAATKSALSGHWYDYEIRCAGDGYIAKAAPYQGSEASFYTNQLSYFETVYVLNSSFNITGAYDFGSFPSDISYSNGRYFVKTTDSTYVSSNGNHWKELSTEYSIPIDNGGVYAVSAKGGEFYAMPDADTHLLIEYPMEEEDESLKYQKPLYIDVIGGYYYYISGSSLMLSENGVSWYEYEADEKITSIKAGDGTVIINEDIEITPELDTDYLLRFDDSVMQLSGIAEIIDDRTMVPLRFLSELAGVNIAWDGEARTVTVSNDKKTAVFTIDSDIALVNGEKREMDCSPVIADGSTMLPIKYFAEFLGYRFSSDEDNRIITVTSTKSTATTSSTLPSDGILADEESALAAAELIIKRSYDIDETVTVTAKYSDDTGYWTVTASGEDFTYTIVMRKSDGGVVEIIR